MSSIIDHCAEIEVEDARKRVETKDKEEKQ